MRSPLSIKHSVNKLSKVGRISVLVFINKSSSDSIAFNRTHGGIFTLMKNNYNNNNISTMIIKSNFNVERMKYFAVF